jgi:hypothetical protein
VAPYNCLHLRKYLVVFLVSNAMRTKLQIGRAANGCCWLILALMMAGCGDGLPKRVPVSGKVTIDGKPVTTGSVRFAPAEGGRLATGSINPDGTFALTTYTRGDGCVVGAHTVTIHACEDVSETARRWHVPKKYGSEGTSGLSYTIDGPTDSLQIELTWGGVKEPVFEQI